MPGADLILERIEALLVNRPEGATSEEIAREAMGLTGAAGPVADSVVTAAVADAARIRRGANGRWELRTRGGTPLATTDFVAFAIAESGEGVVQEAAAIRYSLTGGTVVHETGVLEEGAWGRAFDDLAAFASGAVPTGFRLPGVRRQLDRWRASVGARWRPDEGICLFRLGRRRFPEQPLPTPADLASAAGLVYRDSESVEGRVRALAELGTFLLEGCAADGVDTVEAVLREIHPDPEPVHFDAYAFDEAFLKELPESAGVYLMRDREGVVIYVGKSVNLRSRVGTYFARRDQRSEKTLGILERIWSVEVETVGSELEALLLEHRLIRMCDPEFNTQTEVHPSSGDAIADKRTVLILPSGDPDAAELFCLNRGRLAQLRVRRDFSDWANAVRLLEEMYGADRGRDVGEDGAEALEIVRRWAIRRRDEVNAVDAEGNRLEEVLRQLKDTIPSCRQEAWEKVWQV